MLHQHRHLQIRILAHHSVIFNVYPDECCRHYPPYILPVPPSSVVLSPSSSVSLSILFSASFVLFYVALFILFSIALSISYRTLSPSSLLYRFFILLFIASSIFIFTLSILLATAPSIDCRALSTSFHPPAHHSSVLSSSCTFLYLITLLPALFLILLCSPPPPPPPHLSLLFPSSSSSQTSYYFHPLSSLTYPSPSPPRLPSFPLPRVPGKDPNSDLIPINLRPWHPFGTEMLQAIKNHLPAEVWLTLSPIMYLSFWSFSLYDIMVPTEKYETELKRLRERSKLLLLSALPANTGTYVHHSHHISQCTYAVFSWLLSEEIIL